MPPLRVGWSPTRKSFRRIGGDRVAPSAADGSGFRKPRGALEATFASRQASVSPRPRARFPRLSRRLPGRHDRYAPPRSPRPRFPQHRFLRPARLRLSRRGACAAQATCGRQPAAVAMASSSAVNPPSGPTSASTPCPRGLRASGRAARPPDRRPASSVAASRPASTSAIVSGGGDLQERVAATLLAGLDHAPARAADRAPASPPPRRGSSPAARAVSQPSSVSFSTIHFWRSPLGSATASVSGRGGAGGACGAVRRRRAPRGRGRARVTRAGHSRPLPSNSETASPTFARSTRARCRASSPESSARPASGGRGEEEAFAHEGGRNSGFSRAHFVLTRTDDPARLRAMVRDYWHLNAAPFDGTLEPATFHAGRAAGGGARAARMARRRAAAVRPRRGGRGLWQEPPRRDGGPPARRARGRDGAALTSRARGRRLDRDAARAAAARRRQPRRAAAALAEAREPAAREHAHGTDDGARLRRHRPRRPPTRSTASRG